MTESPRTGRPYFNRSTSDLVKAITNQWAAHSSYMDPHAAVSDVLDMVEELTARYDAKVATESAEPRPYPAFTGVSDNSAMKAAQLALGRPSDYLTDHSLADTIARVLNLPTSATMPEYLTALKDECHVRALELNRRHITSLITMAEGQTVWSSNLDGSVLTAAAKTAHDQHVWPADLERAQCRCGQGNQPHYTHAWVSAEEYGPPTPGVTDYERAQGTMPTP